MRHTLQVALGAMLAALVVVGVPALLFWSLEAVTGHSVALTGRTVVAYWILLGLFYLPALLVARTCADG